MTDTRSSFLDVLRALAICLVLLRHGVSVSGLQPPESMSLLLLYNLANNGWLGVDLFFVLSGFLLSSQIISAVQDQTYRVSTFVKRRALRTLPAYFVVLLLLWSGVLATQLDTPGVGDPGALLAHIFFLNDYFQPAISVIFWSLATEEKFYLLMALVVPILTRFHPLIAVGFIITAIFSIIAFRTVAYASAPVHDYSTFFWTYRAPFHFALDGLVMGVLAGFLHHHWPSIRGGSSVNIALIGLLLTLLCSTNWITTTDSAGALFAIPAFSAVTLALIFRHLSFDRIIRPSLARPSRFLARISFSVYLVHYPAAQLTFGFVTDRNLSQLTFWIFYLVSATLLACALHYLIEAPSLRFRERVAPRERVAEKPSALPERGRHLAEAPLASDA